MKRIIINPGAVLAAFVIGLAINNACAKIGDNKSNSRHSLKHTAPC